MTDAHVHIERGPYTLEWIGEFVKNAQARGIDELWLLEHNYRFKEFVPMYDGVCAASAYIDEWFHRKAGVRKFDEYLSLIEKSRLCRWPVRLRFGLEICYFPEQEELIRALTRDAGLDFLLGSVHFVDDFAFDHLAEHWDGQDVDRLYRRYFQLSVQLAESRLFNGVAHPDCIKLFGHKPSFDLSPYYEAFAEAVAHHGFYAEQSTGIHRRTGAPIGMERALLEAMRRRGVRIITASDAHTPEDVGLCIPEAVRLLEEWYYVNLYFDQCF